MQELIPSRPHDHTMTPLLTLAVAQASAAALNASHCVNFVKQFGCLSTYQRFCEITRHEEWRSEDEFVEAWQTYAGHNQTCSEENTTEDGYYYCGAIFFMIVYIIAIIMEALKCCDNPVRVHSTTNSDPVETSENGSAV